MTGTRFTLEIQPDIPAELVRLKDLANDLYYSWDRHSRGLFYALDHELWEACRHNPRVFLRRISQHRLLEAIDNEAFMHEYHQTLDSYDAYNRKQSHPQLGRKIDPEQDLIVYFCAEFGLHESLPIYSGGLGILAGDYCKSASDLGLPFIAIGLLYRHGNFVQTIDDHGNQVLHNVPVILDDLLIKPALCDDGNEVVITISLPQTEIFVKVWQARVGRTTLYLLDTDIDDNSPQDRQITSDIYPDDRHIRLKQEIVLGIGGVRAIYKMGLAPTIWHINEGYPCLLLVERWCRLIRQGFNFHDAVELTAANTIFSTHTPINAGHEVYQPAMIREYLYPFIKNLGIDEKIFFELGRNEHQQDFNFTSFSLRCSGYYNGVSRIHRDVAANMEQHVWPEIPVNENPMAYITNGIHVPTFMAKEWHEIIDGTSWQNQTLNPDYWSCINDIDNHRYWEVRRTLKQRFIEQCCELIEKRCLRHGQGKTQVNNITEHLRNNDDLLLIGFARRFATYKRADLLLENPDRLRRILGNEDRPVIILFAGKAHPNDEHGKQLIHKIHAISQQPEFIGRVILLEGYDMALARKMVSGVDLWLNTPEFPMEACGTSGMKAAVNGVLNLSVMDGWWAEGYNKDNGWAIQPYSAIHDHGLQRQLESEDLLQMLEEEVIPMYFERKGDIPERWIRMSKESIRSILPRFNSHRMVADYVNQLYVPARSLAARLNESNGEQATELAYWKRRINSLWTGLELYRVDTTPKTIRQGSEVNIGVNVRLNGLHPDDIMVECLIGRIDGNEHFISLSCYPLQPSGNTDGETTLYSTSFVPDMSGLIAYKIRAYPYHPLLSHPLNMGRMKWI